MGGGVAGLSVAVAAAAALAASISIAALAYIISATTVQPPEAAAREAAVKEAERLGERISLVYWEPGGLAWISNDGPRAVTIVEAVVDGEVRWSGELTLQPGEKASIRVGWGDELALVTGTGAVHVLRRWEG